MQQDKLAMSVKFIYVSFLHSRKQIHFSFMHPIIPCYKCTKIKMFIK